MRSLISILMLIVMSHPAVAVAELRLKRLELVGEAEQGSADTLKITVHMPVECQTFGAELKEVNGAPVNTFALEFTQSGNSVCDRPEKKSAWISLQLPQLKSDVEGEKVTISYGGKAFYYEIMHEQPDGPLEVLRPLKQ